MREYVPEKDDHLRRTADNLSAVLRRLLTQSETRSELLAMTRSLSEAQISDLSSVSSDLGDVMVTIDERIGGKVRSVPARLMSDGTLRFLSMAAAMLDTPSDNDLGADRVLVIEELENGLHPSQAALLLQRLKTSANSRKVRTLATTHSPAILDALEGSDHESVVVTSRDEEGWSRVTRLVDFPDYLEILGKDSLGGSATHDRLRPGEVDVEAKQASLRSLLAG
jgi:predicted ATPase